MGSAPRQGFHQGTIGETLTDRAQRRQRDARQHLATQAHHRVNSLLEGQGLLVICGPSEVTHHFVSDLLPAIAQRTICTTELAPEASDADRIQHVREALETLRSNRQLAWFMALRERLYIDRHAALGLQSVKSAIAMGAADHVIMTEAFIKTYPVDAERLVQNVVLHGASVSIIAENVAALVNRDAEGIAAELRYAVPTVTPPSLAAQPLTASMSATGASL
jgi:stalled ribosome rescue protein Dom34